jgi:hypothetical protein
MPQEFDRLVSSKSRETWVVMEKIHGCGTKGGDKKSPQTLCTIEIMWVLHVSA